MIVTNAVEGQVVKQPLTVQYAGFGGYSKKFSDIFSAVTNQAAVAQLKAGGFGVYGERRFLLEELNGYAAVVAVPTASGVLGVEADYFGSQAYNENELGFLYARKIPDRVDIGTKFNYYQLRVPGYGNASSINFEAGTILHFTDKVHAGFHTIILAEAN